MAAPLTELNMNIMSGSVRKSGGEQITNDGERNWARDLNSGP